MLPRARAWARSTSALAYCCGARGVQSKGNQAVSTAGAKGGSEFSRRRDKLPRIELRIRIAGKRCQQARPLTFAKASRELLPKPAAGADERLLSGCSPKPLRRLDTAQALLGEDDLGLPIFMALLQATVALFSVLMTCLTRVEGASGGTGRAALGGGSNRETTDRT